MFNYSDKEKSELLKLLRKISEENKSDKAELTRSELKDLVSKTRIQSDAQLDQLKAECQYIMSQLEGGEEDFCLKEMLCIIAASGPRQYRKVIELIHDGSGEKGCCVVEFTMQFCMLYGIICMLETGSEMILDGKT